MKALVYYEPGKYLLEEKPVPKIKTGDVLLKMKSCGICGTDIRIFTSGHHAIKGPITTGHEIVGEVVENRSTKRGLKKGQQVIVVTPVGCMKCKYCKKGAQNMCPKVANEVHSIGYYTDGGFAEYIRIPKEAVNQNVLIPIPKTTIPYEHFALCEPLSCVINGQDKLKITKDDVVVILGAGPIGCMHAYLAKAKKAKKIILADLVPSKLRMAKHAPADIFVDASKKDVKEVVMKETNGEGAGVVIVAAPSGVGQELAIEIAAIQGRVSFFGGLPKTQPTITLKSNLVHYREIEVYGAFASSRKQYQEALSLILKRRIDTHKMVTHSIPLKDVDRAVEIMKRGESIKIVIVPE